MDTYSTTNSSIEPISKRPFAQKRFRQTSTFKAPNGKHFSSFLFDIYRHLFRILEEHNLELAYRFRYVVEAAGCKPFLKRQFKLDKALKRATNRVYQPLGDLLDEIQLEFGLDFDFLFPTIDLSEFLHPQQEDEVLDDEEMDVGYAAETLTSVGNDNFSPLEWMNRYSMILELKDEVTEQPTKKYSARLHENARFELDDIRNLTEKNETAEPESPQKTVEKTATPYARKIVPPVEQSVSDDIEEIGEEKKTPVLQYSFENFKLPTPKDDEFAETSDNLKEEENEPQPVGEAKKPSKKGVPSTDTAESVSAKGLNPSSFESTSAGVTKASNRKKLLGPEESKKHLKLPIPPPLYKFKIEFKKPSDNLTSEVSDPDKLLVISQDCIDRRTNTNSEQDHFLNGSTFWTHFRKLNESPMAHQDTTSLIVNPDCIAQRTKNIKLKKQHAMELTQGEEETFKAIDTLITSKKEETEAIDSGETAANDDDTTRDIDGKEEEIDNDQQRQVFYQQSLDNLVNKDGTLFDYLSGKIAIDETDKFEIEKWVRAQRSYHTEVYRVYSEAILQPDISDMAGVQNFAKNRLRTQDFPSQRVRDIFDTIKERENIKTLERDDLVRILKRQDFLKNGDNANNTSVTFSRAYSRYREWRSNIESPDIKVRTEDSSFRPHIIPQSSVIKRLDFAESPVISVRTSSDYLKRQTLPILDKISGWRKPGDA